MYLDNNDYRIWIYFILFYFWLPYLLFDIIIIKYIQPTLDFINPLQLIATNKKNEIINND